MRKAKTKEELKEYVINYRLENKEKMAIKRKAYCLLNKDKQVEYQKKYYIDNSLLLIEKSKNYLLKNRNKINESSVKRNVLLNDSIIIKKLKKEGLSYNQIIENQELIETKRLTIQLKRIFKTK